MIRLQSASLGEWDRGQNYLPYKTGFCTEHDKQGAFCNVRHTDHGGQNVIFTLHTDHDDPLLQDFVVIKEAPKKRRVLTEHQKEIMKEKR